MKTSVQQFIDAQILSIGGGFRCNAATTQVINGVEEVNTEILCSQETTLSRVVGKEKLDFRVSSTAEYGIDKIDVAFMFDISGSMNSSSRLRNLKEAAKEAIEVLLPPDAPAELKEDTRIAMISYNSMVNAGPYFELVTGVPPTRTYTHTIAGSASTVTPNWATQEAWFCSSFSSSEPRRQTARFNHCLIQRMPARMLRSKRSLKS